MSDSAASEFFKLFNANLLDALCEVSNCGAVRSVAEQRQGSSSQSESQPHSSGKRTRRALAITNWLVEKRFVLPYRQGLIYTPGADIGAYNALERHCSAADYSEDFPDLPFAKLLKLRRRESIGFGGHAGYKAKTLERELQQASAGSSSAAAAAARRESDGKNVEKGELGWLWRTVCGKDTTQLIDTVKTIRAVQKDAFGVQSASRATSGSKAGANDSFVLRAIASRFQRRGRGHGHGSKKHRASSFDSRGSAGSGSGPLGGLGDSSSDFETDSDDSDSGGAAARSAAYREMFSRFVCE